MKGVYAFGPQPKTNKELSAQYDKLFGKNRYIRSHERLAGENEPPTHERHHIKAGAK